MNKSFKKLVSSIRSNNFPQQNEPKSFDIPARKKMIDALHLFYEALQKNPNLKNNSSSFENFSLGYMFAVDNLLKRIATIQRYFSSHGICDDEIQRFGNEVKNKQSDDYISDLFLKVSKFKDDDSNAAFFAGYRMAEINVDCICTNLYAESFKVGMSDSSLYTYFWDFTATELIDVTPELAISLPNNIY